MHASYVSYFNITTPVTILFLGLLLLGCWTIIRKQRELLWIAAGYIISAITLLAQSGLDNDGFARWTLLTTPAYVFAAWCLGRGLAVRYNTNSHPILACTLVATSAAVLYYFGHISPDLQLRVIGLNTFILIAHALALPAIFRTEKKLSTWDTLLLSSYVLFCGLILVRIVVILLTEPVANTDLLTQSPYWRYLVVSTHFFSLWFLVILIGSTLTSIVSNLKEERDHDALTGLLNRRAFFEQAGKRLKSPLQRHACILTLDIDHFKSVNDTYGHDIGDSVLTRVAEIVRGSLSAEHIASRFGGEEFVVLMGASQPHEGEAIAQTIQTKLSNLSFNNGPKSLTASFGLSMVRSYGELEQALRQADIALYSAKKNGRDQIKTAALID